MPKNKTTGRPLCYVHSFLDAMESVLNCLNEIPLSLNARTHLGTIGKLNRNIHMFMIYYVPVPIF